MDGCSIQNHLPLCYNERRMSNLDEIQFIWRSCRGENSQKLIILVYIISKLLLLAQIRDRRQGHRKRWRIINKKRRMKNELKVMEVAPLIFYINIMDFRVTLSYGRFSMWAFSVYFFTYRCQERTLYFYWIGYATIFSSNMLLLYILLRTLSTC